MNQDLNEIVIYNCKMGLVGSTIGAKYVWVDRLADRDE